MVMSTQEFTKALSEAQNQALVNVIDSDNNDWSSVDQIIEAFTKDNRNNSPGRVFSRLIESFDPTVITADQEATFWSCSQAWVKDGRYSFTKFEQAHIDCYVEDNPRQAMSRLLSAVFNVMNKTHIERYTATQDEPEVTLTPQQKAAQTRARNRAAAAGGDEEPF